LKKETALLFDASLGIELLNVPRNFRRLNKFKGQEKLVPSSVDPTNLRLVKGKDGVNEMMCKVMKDLES
jgi:hypothetical protein